MTTDDLEQKEKLVPVLIRLTPRDLDRLIRIARAKELTRVDAVRLWLREEDAKLPKQAV